jgi:hypothetical protein
MLQRPPKADRKRSAAARRAKRYRQRLRDGKIVIPIEADEALLDLLVGLNWLQERDASDRAAIKAALKAMLADASMFRDAGR